MEEDFRAIRRLMLAANKIDGAYYLFAKKLGIKENTLAVLYALDDGELHTQTQLGEEWLIPKTTVNTIIRELESQGYVQLLSRGQNREKTICLTEAGKIYAAEIMKSTYEAEQAALRHTLERFSAEFVEAYDCFSDCLCQEIEKRLPKETRRKHG